MASGQQKNNMFRIEIVRLSPQKTVFRASTDTSVAEATLVTCVCAASGNGTTTSRDDNDCFCKWPVVTSLVRTAGGPGTRVGVAALTAAAATCAPDCHLCLDDMTTPSSSSLYERLGFVPDIRYVKRKEDGPERAATAETIVRMAGSRFGVVVN